jgi:SAM-dependent methyltransferase
MRLGAPRQNHVGTGMRRRPDARVLSESASNVNWMLGNGIDLSGLDNEFVDFAFSYIVLQHMPAPEFALRYIQEMLRVLKVGGVFLFQFNSVSAMTMNWKGRMAWEIVDFPWTLGFRGVSRGVASLLGLSPEMAGKSWRGASLDLAAVRKSIDAAGSAIEDLTGENTPMTWCRGSKLRSRKQ